MYSLIQQVLSRIDCKIIYKLCMYSDVVCWSKPCGFRTPVIPYPRGVSGKQLSYLPGTSNGTLGPSVLLLWDSNSRNLVNPQVGVFPISILPLLADYMKYCGNNPNTSLQYLLVPRYCCFFFLCSENSSYFALKF